MRNDNISGNFLMRVCSFKSAAWFVFALFIRNTSGNYFPTFFSSVLIIWMTTSKWNIDSPFCEWETIWIGCSFMLTHNTNSMHKYNIDTYNTLFWNCGDTLSKLIPLPVFLMHQCIFSWLDVSDMVRSFRVLIRLSGETRQAPQ